MDDNMTISVVSGRAVLGRASLALNGSEGHSSEGPVSASIGLWIPIL